MTLKNCTYKDLEEFVKPLTEAFSFIKQNVCKDAGKKMNTLGICVFFSILFFSTAINLNAQNGNDVLKKIQDKFKSINNFSADFIQTISDPEGQQNGKLSGKFFYKRKNKFAVELKNSSIISDGITVWNYDSRSKRVIISNFRDEPTSFSLERYIFDYPTLCKIKYGGSDKGSEEIIELVPKENYIDFKSAKIWKSSDNMISRMEIIDLADVKYVFQLSSVKIDQDIKDSKFSFATPKGIKIIDLR